MIRYSGMENAPGAPGNNFYAGVDLPFGGGGRYKTIQEQNKPGRRDYDPVRKFPQGEPGREGAIDIQFRRAMFPGAGSMPAIGNMGGMQMAQGMPVVPMMGVPQNPFGVYDHPGLRGMPSRSIYDGGNDLPQMFPMQPGGYGVPQGMPGSEFDRKIPPANVVKDVPPGFTNKFVS